ncbi:MAG: hypothetical protein ACREK5_02010 [Gemmatimonadota bacterium]
MPDVLIENPILNSPYEEPSRHFLFGDEGITGEVVDERRRSSYFVPVPRPKKRSQLRLDTEWTSDRIQENAEGLTEEEVEEILTELQAEVAAGNLLG